MQEPQEKNLPFVLEKKENTLFWNNVSSIFLICYVPGDKLWHVTLQRFYSDSCWVFMAVDLIGLLLWCLFLLEDACIFSACSTSFSFCILNRSSSYDKGRNCTSSG